MNNISSKEKAELMKQTIFQLYSKEGRSMSYISRLLCINRKTISDKIKEWGFPEAEPRRHLSPSSQKFINKNRTLIKSRLDHDVPITKIAQEIGCSRDIIQKTAVKYDEVLKKAHEDYIRRLHDGAAQAREEILKNSSRNYNFDVIEGEEWRPVLGYPGYDVSDHGRVRHYIKRYKTYALLTPHPNAKSGRLYIALTDGNKWKNLNLARVVAHAFIEGQNEEHNTVNHKDGDVSNNCAGNLEWISMAENSQHAHRVLKRGNSNRERKHHFSKIIYKGKYEFKTITALAKFLGKSKTQTYRYLEEAEKHDIRLVN